VFFVLLSSKTNAQIPSPIIDSVITTQYIECPGEDGCLTVYINPNGFVGNYDIVLQKANVLFQMQAIVIFGPTGVIAHQFCGLSSGVYQVLLTDPNFTPPYPTAFNYDSNLDPDIFSVFTTALVDPLPLTVTPSDSGLFCWDDTNAVISVSLGGYTEPYVVTLKDDANNTISGPTTLGPTDSSYTFPIGLVAGDYTICATDVFSCPEVCVSHTIVSPDTLRPEISDSAHITCYDASDGEITVSVQGGTPWTVPTITYNYSWTGPGGYTASTAAITGLGPGTYSCLITDSLGCDTTISFTIIEPGPLSGTAAITNTINCKDSCNGEITVTLDPLNPGAGPAYSYELLDGLGTTITSTTGIFSGLCAGVYIATIFDVDGCDSTVATLTLEEPDYLQFNIDTISYNGFGVSCNGVCDAEITIDSVWGGNLAPYGYS
jgi:hypothetical protein